MAGVADILAPDYPNLAKLLRAPTPAGPPLLAAAFCYFFRREVETNDELAHGLFFDGLRQLTASQAKAFGEVGKAMAALGGQFDAVFEQLGRIGRRRGDERRRGHARRRTGPPGRNAAAWRPAPGQRRRGARPLEQVQQQLGQAGMQRGEVRPQAPSASAARTSGGRSRRCWPGSAICPRRSSGGCRRCSTVWASCRSGRAISRAPQTFAEVAGCGRTRGQGGGCYNAYRAALEERKWTRPWRRSAQAAALDRRRFAPFPLHRFEPRGILGAGGFGTAFLCHDRNFDEEVVVKTLHAADLERSLDDVFREARILRRLSHPAIIGVRDCDYADPAAKARPYLVMEYFAGVTLEQFIVQRGVLTPEQLLAVAAQMAGACRRRTARACYTATSSRPTCWSARRANAGR